MCRPQKNLARLIEAFAVVKDELRDDLEYHNLKLLVIGDSLAPHPDLRRAVVRARLREDVRFLGFVPFAALRAFLCKSTRICVPFALRRIRSSAARSDGQWNAGAGIGRLGHTRKCWATPRFS